MQYLITSIRASFGEEAAKEVTTVTAVVKSKIVARNLFGWREFLEDILVDIASYMIQTDFKYSGGAYVALGMQAAIDACRYCSAQKRRGDYETISIHDIEAFTQPQQPISYEQEVNDLVMDIETILGVDIAEKLKSYLMGDIDRLSKDVLDKCRTPEFEAWLKNYR